MGKWNKLVRQAIKEVKKNGSRTYWVSKLLRPVGMEVFECDDLLMVPRIGKKTASLLNSVGLFTVKDVMDLADIDAYLSTLNVSDNRKTQIATILQHTASNANPGKPTTFFHPIISCY